MNATSNKTERSTFSLKIWRGSMPIQLIDSLRKAVRSMWEDSRVDLFLSEKGYTDHTWESMMGAAGGSGELWLAIEGGRVLGFLLAGYSKEVDNEPTFVIKQAWVDPEIRRTDKVKSMLTAILLNAKSNFAKHVLIVSSRNTKAYLRWLGKGWIPVTTILKGDL